MYPETNHIGDTLIFLSSGETSSQISITVQSPNSLENYCQTSVNFLDTKISFNNGTLQLTIYKNARPLRFP